MNSSICLTCGSRSCSRLAQAAVLTPAEHRIIQAILAQPGEPLKVMAAQYAFGSRASGQRSIDLSENGAFRVWGSEKFNPLGFPAPRTPRDCRGSGFRGVYLRLWHRRPFWTAGPPVWGKATLSRRGLRFRCGIRAFCLLTKRRPPLPGGLRDPLSCEGTQSALRSLRRLLCCGRLLCFVVFGSAFFLCGCDAVPRCSTHGPPS
jgi:hypothetical protein